MAIKIYEQFAPFANPADGDYPYGSIKNDSIPGAEDGTPLDSVWGNDYAGFDAALFAEAGITPSGSADTALVSQRLEALKLLNIKNLTLAYEFESVSDMQASTKVFPLNKKLKTGRGEWVVNSTDGVTIAGGLKARPIDRLYGKDYGQKTDGTDSRQALYDMFVAAHQLQVNCVVERGDTFIDTISTNVSHGGVSHTIPVGFKIEGLNLTIEFEEGAQLYIDDQTQKEIDFGGQIGRHYIIFVSQGEVNLISPNVKGDKELHTGALGEFGYGIFYADNATGTISNPTSINMWGDSIAWSSSLDGFITGVSTTENSRRQGISVFNCGYLYIEHNKSKDIDGAPNGPWAAIDVEPNTKSEGIRNLVIGRVDASNCRGGSFLTFLGSQDGTSDPFSIEIGTASSIGCNKGVSVAVPTRFTKGVITIDKIIGNGDDTSTLEISGFVNSSSMKVNSIESIMTNPTNNPNQFYAPLVITNQSTTELFADTGNIQIGSLSIINDVAGLPAPMSIFPWADGVGGFGEIIIETISYNKSAMINKGIINTAQARIMTNSNITHNATTSGTLGWDKWANHITNEGATSAIALTAVSDYGYNGMLLKMESVAVGHAFTFVHTVNKIGPYNELTASSAGGVAELKNLGVGDYWSILASTYGKFSPGGRGSYTSAKNIGGPTSARPATPELWQSYFDTTLNKDVRFNGSSWVSSANGTPA